MNECDMPFYFANFTSAMDSSLLCSREHCAAGRCSNIAFCTAGCRKKTQAYKLCVMYFMRSFAELRFKLPCRIKQQTLLFCK